MQCHNCETKIVFCEPHESTFAKQLYLLLYVHGECVCTSGSCVLGKFTCEQGKAIVHHASFEAADL